ncbi:hypothetical protein MML48_5g00012515 [Holotrichia oblita]|uniref:Uncharacterized protein n=1 Tax=Holotrichia oblita TaxID=644536 RepID=A0ACB9T121_HOLOL|nr:hypothetical protein MML48_5g00012515 [Holotrichia oblita]
MHYGPLISKLLLSFIIASSVLYRYGNWFRHHVIVTLIVLLAWYFSLLIIFALPLDVISTVFRQCTENNIHFEIADTNHTNNTVTCIEPWSNVPEQVFPNLWRTVYWSMQFLTWLVMPMMQSYIKAGDFTIKGKLKSALIDNAIYYGSYLFICGVLLIYLALKPGIDLDWPKLKAITSSASNTWGLFLLVLLLGYALVEVPRKLWNNSNYSYVLNHAYFKAAKLSSDKAEAEESVDDVLEEIPPEDTPTDCPSEKAFIRIHKQVIKALQVLQRTETQWNLLVERIFSLEDIMKNLNSRERMFKHTFDTPRNKLTRFIYSSTIEWYWKCFLYCYCKKTLAVLAAILSVAVVWSEVTFFNKEPPLSIFAIIVNISRDNYDYLTIEILSTVVILYLCYCAYSTVLKIKLLNLYYLAPHHQTNEYSLIFSGMMLSRLTPPLCLNFLGLIHMDSHIIKVQVLETHYTQIMGHMDVIAIISDGFNVYFPMAILAFCLATYFSIGSRILSMLGFHQFLGDDEMTTDLVNEGRELIKREKRKRQRAEESMNRRREYQERFPNANRFRNRSSTDTIRSNDPNESTRTNLLRNGENLDSYDGTRIQMDEVDTRFSPDISQDIDARFGISTRNIINERYDSSTELEPAFSESYQLTSTNNRNRVGLPPRGIFDDV